MSPVDTHTAEEIRALVADAERAREEQSTRKRNLIVQYVVVLVTVGLVIASTLITVGAVKEENDRQTVEIEKQKQTNVALFRNDAELREIIGNQRIILTELSVNLQTLMESKGIKYKRAQ